MNGPRLWLLLASLSLVTPSCESSTPGPMVDSSAADLRVPDTASDQPSPVDSARDLGPDAMPAPRVTGVIDEGNDGSAVVGERVTLQGSALGASCEVLFGTVRATLIGASPVDLVFQVPEGIPVGTQAPVLSCPNGQATFSLQVIRYHLVTSPGKGLIFVLQETVPGVIEKTSIELAFPTAERVVLSPDSAYAYVATARTNTSPRVGIIDLCAGGGPALLSDVVPYNEPVKMPVLGMASASQAPLLAVAGGLYVVFYDLHDPRHPVRSGAVQLVAAQPGQLLPDITVGFFNGVALSPDGMLAALLDGAADELRLYDLLRPSAPTLLGKPVRVSGGTPVKPIISLPFPISGLLGLIKVQGGSAQEVAISADGMNAIVLAGGGLGALAPESFNLDLHNTTISVLNLPTGSYANQLETLSQAHFPNGVAYSPSGDAFVSSVSSSSALLIKLLFQIGVGALISGGLSLTSVASLIFGNFSDLIDIIKAAFNGTILQFGGLHRIVSSQASLGGFRQIPEIQGGLCATYDGSRLLAAGQAWNVDVAFGFPDVIKRFVFKYELGYTTHDTGAGTSFFTPLAPWTLNLLLPPWSFGQTACQQ